MEIQDSVSLSFGIEQQIEDLRPDGDVEGRDRLVRDTQLRLQGDGTGDADALALAVEELVRIAADGVRFKAGGRKQLRDSPAPLRPVADPADGRLLGDDCTDREAGIERGIIGSSSQAVFRVGVDVGGRFTCLVAYGAGGVLHSAKAPSLPSVPRERRGILVRQSGSGGCFSYTSPTARTGGLGAFLRETRAWRWTQSCKTAKATGAGFEVKLGAGQVDTAAGIAAEVPRSRGRRHRRRTRDACRDRRHR